MTQMNFYETDSQTDMDNRLAVSKGEGEGSDGVGVLG